MLTLLAIVLLAQAPARTIDACALITGDSVSRILSVDIRSTRPVTEAAHGVLLNQCYVSTGTARSISIAVAGPMTSGSRVVTPREFWREQFHAARHDGSSHQHGGADGERENGTPRPISGVGDEAFWSGSRIAGALYVLRGETFIRVSVGGIADERERIEKSRQLAAAALRHLPRH